MEPTLAASENSTTVRFETVRRQPRTPMQNAMAVLRPAVRVMEQVGPPASTWLCERLFLTPVPRRPKLPERELAVARLAVRFQVELDGRTMAGWRWGAGERAVLLVHGWGGHALQLAAFVRPLLERGLSVAAFDFPSHGESEGKRTDLPEMIRALAAVGRELPRLVGMVAHSLGGAAAAVAASRQSPMVERLVLLAGPAHFRTAEERFCAMTGLSPQTFERMRLGIEKRTGEQWAQLEPMALVHRLGIPGLLFHSDDDGELPITHAETLARLWPRATLARRQGLGHYRLLRDPGVVEEAVRFLDQG